MAGQQWLASYRGRLTEIGARRAGRAGTGRRRGHAVEPRRGGHRHCGLAADAGCPLDLGAYGIVGQTFAATVAGTARDTSRSVAAGLDTLGAVLDPAHDGRRGGRAGRGGPRHRRQARAAAPGLRASVASFTDSADDMDAGKFIEAGQQTSDANQDRRGWTSEDVSPG